MNYLKDKAEKMLIFGIVYTMTVLLFFNTLDYTLPFVLAFICAYIIRRPTIYLISTFKLNKVVSTLITTVLFFAVIISVLSWGLTQLAQEAMNLGKNAQDYINLYLDEIMAAVNNLGNFYQNLDPSILSAIENNFSSSITKLSNATVAITGKALSILLNAVASVPYIIMVVVFTMIATYFIAKDMSAARDKLIGYIPEGQEERLLSVMTESKRMLGSYFKSYGAVIGLTFVETLIVFLLFKVKYAFLLSLLSAAFDILPILGMGAIYVPLALIYMFVYHDFFIGIGILVAYLVIIIIRQVVEPKIVSSSLGIHPVAVLAAIFIGLKANGFLGMIFCIFMVVLYTVFRKVDII
jgi:sporulation integral membrane protein YtvI